VGQETLRDSVEAAIRRLEKWSVFQERHESEMRAMGRFPREIGPDVPTASNIKELTAQLRRSLQGQ